MSGGRRGEDPFPVRFGRHVRRSGALAPGDAAVVAFSGGLDSMVLLHVLRFHAPVPELRITAAHFDHRMRGGSARDAAWVRGLARAWDVPLETGAAAIPPAHEAEARTQRYAFLRQVQADAGARRLLTAHHADDQAETVLFRAVRGTGIRGLGGIPPRGPGGLVRPLLPFRRGELEAWARGARLAWREDPTNRDPGHARNVLRHRVLPSLEAEVAPGARRALARLARLARRDEAAWKSLLPDLLEAVVEAASEERIVVARSAFLAYHPAVRARVLRALARRLDSVLDEAGTRAALEFTSRGASGRRHALPGGAVLVREFDRLVLTPADAPAPFPAPGAASGRVEISGPGEGGATLRLPGRDFRVVWSTAPGIRERWVERFAADRLVFPLGVRGWAPGDRIRLPYGTKKLKKLFSEARIPRGERPGRPVLVDGKGRVQWVPGVARTDEERPAAGGQNLTIGITDADDV